MATFWDEKYAYTYLALPLDPNASCYRTCNEFSETKVSNTPLYLVPLLLETAAKNHWQDDDPAKFYITQLAHILNESVQVMAAYYRLIQRAQARKLISLLKPCLNAVTPLTFFKKLWTQFLYILDGCAVIGFQSASVYRKDLVEFLEQLGPYGCPYFLRHQMRTLLSEISNTVTTQLISDLTHFIDTTIILMQDMERVFDICPVFHDAA